MILKTNSFSNSQLFSSHSPWSRSMLRVWTCSAWRDRFESGDWSKYWSYAQVFSGDIILCRCSKNWNEDI